MKTRRLFILIALWSCCLAVWAVPAKPGWQTITQSDGTTLKVRMVGNAFNHAILTADGLTVARGADGDFYYISSLTGLTTVRAHEADQRGATENAFVAAQRGTLTMQFKQWQMPRQKDAFGVGGSNADAGVPANGQRRVPIILVEFADKKFNNTRQDIIDQMLTGDKSVGAYFRDQSNGLYQPVFDVYGIYELSQNREYYGGHEGDSNDRYLGAMVTEAIQLAASEGVSFKPYDTNSDDYCDVVIVIYAGVGEAQAWWNHPEAIWPCNWYLSSASYYGNGGNGAFRPKSGDPYVDMFAVFNELHGSEDETKTIDGIGTFAHEFGHCLGLPDFYDTGGGDHHGMGSWDIMCNGCYNNNGFTPAGYTAYEKVFMGWLDYITPVPGTYYTLPAMNQKNAATDKALRIQSNLNANEYFIVENRRKQGWDRYNPGEGIMITHVTFKEDRWWYNTPNNQDIQLMTIMNADNSWTYSDESTDLWPQGDNNAFTDSSTPAAKLNMRSNGSITGSAGYLGKPVTGMVINDDGTASFWYMKGSATSPIISVSTDNINMGDVMLSNTRTVTFTVAGDALRGNVNLTLNDADGVFSITPTVISAANAGNCVTVTVTFEPTVLQNYSGTITLSSSGAQPVVVNLTGRGILLTSTPVMLPADSNYINLTEFRAEWIDETPAENVTSYTLEVSLKPEVQLLETADFTTVPNALNDEGTSLVDITGRYTEFLPEGWTCTPYLFAYGGSLISGYGGTIMTPTYDLTGYDKVTVVLNTSSYYYSYYGAAAGTISTSVDSEPFRLGSDFENLVVVLDCAANDKITIQTDDNLMSLRGVEIYAGEMIAEGLMSRDTDSETYRFIENITDKFCTVRDLAAGGSFVYKVKAVYYDGTESAWSERKVVTLFENGHGYSLGDVNHDRNIDITDVTLLINAVLTGSADGCCPVCSDLDFDGELNISDVTRLISYVLTGELAD